MPKYLVTSALPYANGPLHLGHIAGAYLPADIFVRYLRLNGDDVVYISGSDEHGVPVTIRAEKEGLTPQDIVNRYHAEFKRSFARMSIDFDNFSGTSRREHHYPISQRFFNELEKNGHIVKKTEQQFYCEHDKRFLPDRYVEGDCPHCGYDRARGDQCDKCGKLLNPIELVKPRCALCGKAPVIRETSHWYLKLQDFEQKLKEWLSGKKNWKDNVRRFVLGWIDSEGLRERSITRDINWGIPVPREDAQGKVLYVWFDAPIGYISSTMEWAAKAGTPDRWKEYWLERDTRLVHFIGKDNIPFHAVTWPAVLMGQDQPFVLPYDIPANEYLTLEGEKFSTSMNWAVWVDEYLEKFPADPLRYFLASNAPESKDADFSWKAFQARNNDELANIIGNFANRTLTFIKNFCGGQVPAAKYTKEDKDTFSALESKMAELREAFSQYRVREASKLMMDIGRIGNKYFDDTKPWVLKKDDPARLSTVMNVCVNMLRMLAVAMYPIVPNSALKLWAMIGEKVKLTDERWDSAAKARVKEWQKTGETEILFAKYEDDLIQAQLDSLKAKSAAAAMEKNKEGNKMEEQKTNAPAATPAENKPAEKTTVTIDEFRKFDLRVAEVLSAEPLEKSNKLLKLKVKVGESEKQVMAGIKQFYKPEELVGKKIIILNNLEPAKLMGETSEGMLLAAGSDDRSKVIVLTPAGDIESGAKVS